SGLRVVACDRHHEPEVRLDQFLLGLLVALVLAPCKLALLGRRQEWPVADRADVKLEGILRGLRLDGDWRFLAFLLLLVPFPVFGLLFDLFGFGLVGDELEPR